MAPAFRSFLFLFPLFTILAFVNSSALERNSPDAAGVAEAGKMSDSVESKLENSIMSAETAEVGGADADPDDKGAVRETRHGRYGHGGYGGRGGYGGHYSSFGRPHHYGYGGMGGGWRGGYGYGGRYGGYGIGGYGGYAGYPYAGYANTYCVLYPSYCYGSAYYRR